MILAEVAISACLLLNINPSVARKCENIVKKVCITDTRMRSYRDCYIKVAPQINVLMKRQYATTLILGDEDVTKKTDEQKKDEKKVADEAVKKAAAEVVKNSESQTTEPAQVKTEGQTSQSPESNEPTIQIQPATAGVEKLEEALAPFLDLEIKHTENQREIDIATRSIRKSADIIKKDLSFIKQAME